MILSMQSGKLLFYFNGFNAAIPEDYSGSEKICDVADFAAIKGYRFIPVSTCYREARAHCNSVLSDIGKDTREAVFCGSSMGGWFARIMQLKLNQVRPDIRSAAVAFNPAFDLGMNSYMLLGKQLNFVTGEAYEWAREHSSELSQLEASVDYNLPIPYFVYIDKGDEVIDWELSAARHAPISRLVTFEEGCHSFDHSREAMAHFGTGFVK